MVTTTLPRTNALVKSGCSTLGRVLTRRKTYNDDPSPHDGVHLKRVLSLPDLILLGVGSTLGVGVYVLAGSVALHDSGPAIVIAFFVAAVASAFAGLCYAEFASKVPRSGSAYVYSYVTVGELTAFIIGWNLVLEYVIGTASVARGFSNYIDVMLGNKMRDALLEAFPINVSFLSPYPDFLSLGMVLVLAMLLSWGVKESALLNNLFTCINLLTVGTVLVAGSFKADFKNWQIPASEIPSSVPKPGKGGFLPFGVVGVMAGAAKCFYGFIGFDGVATTGEEAKNPTRNIPLAIIFSLLISFIAYFGVSAILTLMLPYYLQDSNAPLPHVFTQVGMPAIAKIVTIGALFALCTSMFGGMFPLPRVLYAMASDGMLFSSFATIHPKTQTPVFATLSAGVFTGILAAMFDLDQLVNMLSIGTLLAYTIVALSVLILRYRDPNPTKYEQPMNGSINGTIRMETSSLVTYFGQLVNVARLKYPNSATETVTKWAIAAFMLVQLLLAFSLVRTEEAFQGNNSALAITVNSVVAAIMILTVLIIGMQPQTPITTFKVPFVPLIPCASIFLNTYLMMKLDFHTWIRFAVWLFVGLLIYVFYSIPHSVEGIKDKMTAMDEKQQEKPTKSGPSTKF